MKKILLIGGLSALVLVTLIFFFAGKASENGSAPEAGRPPTPPQISQMNLTRLPVQFSHAAMQEIECQTCHHPVNGKEEYRKCSTSGCHDILGSNARRSPNSYYRIAHESNTEQYYTCMKCHLEVSAQKPDLKQALTGCTASLCHPQ